MLLMKFVGGLLALLPLAAQEQPSQDEIRALVEKWRSESVVERDEAERRLRRFGEAALPELKKALADRDAEVSGRARHLVRIIEVRRKISPDIRRLLPDLKPEVVAGGSDLLLDLLVRVYAERYKARLPKEPLPPLKRSDLSKLIVLAFEVAGTPAEQNSLCKWSADLHVREAIPGIVKLLAHADPEKTPYASHALIELEAREAVPAIAELLESERPERPTGSTPV